MSDLKPCPFCGHVAMMVSIDAEFRAQCSHCSGRTGLCDSPSVALWFWNTRADSAAIATAYTERNRVVAALARMFPSGIAKTEIEGWDPAWHGCVYIDTPEGQMSWHFHESEAHLFAGLPAYSKAWDGHTTDEKYARLARLSVPSALAAAVQAEREELIAMCRRLRKEADKGRLITLGGIIGLIEDRMSGGKPIFNVMDDSRPAPAVDVLKLVYMLIETLDHADGSALHEVFCNGVHAENGSCEGDVRTRELIDKIRALVSPATGEGKENTP